MIPATAKGVTLGVGVFETMIWEDGRVVALDYHWQRLCKGLRLLGLPDVDRQEMTTALHTVHEANGQRLDRLRFTVTQRDETAADLVASATQLHPWPDEERVTLSAFTVNPDSPIAGIKSTSYADHLLALAHARKHSYGEALMMNTRGQLCEGTSSNVFVVIDDEIMTPPTSSGCLSGITRKIILECGLPVKERNISAEELARASEVFITSSTRHIQAVGTLDLRKLPGSVGTVTRAVKTAYRKRLLEL